MTDAQKALDELPIPVHIRLGLGASSGTIVHWYGAFRLLAAVEAGGFSIGDRVRKKGDKGQWHGKIVGFYSTEITPIGYAVESERETGSVQIYPASALEKYDGRKNEKGVETIGRSRGRDA